MSEDIAGNFELMPVVIGFVPAIIFVLIGMATSGLVGLFGVLIGSAIAGFLSKNSTLYALIYGAVIGLICCFASLAVYVFAIFIVVGLFGGFAGKVLQSNLG